MRYYFENHLFVKRSQYIRIKNPHHKQSEKACMCFYTRHIRTHNFTVYINKTEHWVIICNSQSVPLAGWYAPDGGVSAQQFWSDLVGAAVATWRPWRCSSINLLLCKCVYLPSFSLIVLNFCSMYNTNNRAHILSLANIWSTSRQILCYYAF